MQQCSAKSHHSLLEMKEELIHAQHKLQKQKIYVNQLEEEIAFHEIELIQKEIGRVNQQEVSRQLLSHEQWLSFFFQQREILNQIIRDHPTCRLSAQEVLDQILTLITQLSADVYEQES